MDIRLRCCVFLERVVDAGGISADGSGVYVILKTSPVLSSIKDGNKEEMRAYFKVPPLPT
jgi:hypothetical protein